MIGHVTASAPQALLVEDDDIVRLPLEDRLHMEGVSASSVSTLDEARSLLKKNRFDLVVSDIRMPDGSGRDLFEEICHLHPGTPVIFMTAFSSVPDAVALIKAGAVDYITKPFDIDEFIVLIKRTLARAADSRQSELFGLDGESFQAGSGVLGKSAPMRRTEELVARLKSIDSTVLITGESGVGKEVVARLIHRNSQRLFGPFVAVNCAAIPLNLVESELFGHERGAFTGAERRHIGRFEQAQGGTILLDEIAEIPLEVQVKLLRVLQERQVERVGGSAALPLDVRVIAATQVDMADAMARHEFRTDLYWRLNVIHIEIPPLRERKDDILYLARRLTAAHARTMKKDVRGLSDEAEELLMGMSFPGNIRELKNLLEGAVALCTGVEVEAHDLFLLDAQAATSVMGKFALKDIVESAEREAIEETLQRFHGAVGKAAKALRISRKNLWEKMKRYGINH